MPEENAFDAIETPNKGHEKKTGEGHNSESVGNPSLPGDPLRSRGPSKPFPGGFFFDGPSSSRFALGAVLSSITPCSAIYGRRGAILGLKDQVAIGRAVPFRGIQDPR